VTGDHCLSTHTQDALSAAKLPDCCQSALTQEPRFDPQPRSGDDERNTRHDRASKKLAGSNLAICLHRSSAEIGSPYQPPHQCCCSCCQNMTCLHRPSAHTHTHSQGQPRMPSADQCLKTEGGVWCTWRSLPILRPNQSSCR